MVTKVVLTMGATAFKRNCLRLLDEVDRDGIEIIVTKHGVPIARVLPLTAEEKRQYAEERAAVRARQKSEVTS
jgi:prevent-host-death family protein